MQQKQQHLDSIAQTSARRMWLKAQDPDDFKNLLGEFLFQRYVSDNIFQRYRYGLWKMSYLVALKNAFKMPKSETRYR